MAFDFDAAVTAPFRMQPGLRRLAPGAAHLSPAGAGSRHQREKLAVLLSYATQALAVRDGFDERPALQALAAHAAHEHPRHWRWDGRSAEALGVRVRDDGQVSTLAPGRFGTGDEIGRCLLALPSHWRLAGLLALSFEDDLALVDGHDGTIPWLCVALPSAWAPEEKIGRHFAQVHAPVADGRLLTEAAPALTRLVTAGEPWERFVWTITGHPRLHAHPQRLDARRFEPFRDPDELASLSWFRTERQSFIPLPGRLAAFTIRIGLQPLSTALAEPARAARVHAALATMSDAVLHYRGLHAVREPLLQWLARQAGAAHHAEPSS